MKKIDRFLIASFIPPFLVTFGIAIFVLLMQILWVYIDDIAGKGLGMFVVIELMAYKAVGLVPMALPLAILISGVMLMGGLAEHYELSTMKSAGVSLLRIMRPLIFFGAFATLFSYLCNDYIIPVANLNFGSRMYDIREKKPTLSLEEGIFNDDFGNYAIFIGNKDEDGQHIENILIYDHSNASNDRLSEVIAESGKMSSSTDGSYLSMQLFNGHQYVESKPNRGSTKNTGLPFVRTSFSSWNKVFDLSEFNMDVTKKELFSENRTMMSISQLERKIGTIQDKIDERYYNLAKQISIHYSNLPADSLYAKPLSYPEDKKVVKDTVIRKRDSLATKPVPPKSASAQPKQKKTKPTKQNGKAAKRIANMPKAGQKIEKPTKKEHAIELFLAKDLRVEEWLDSVSTVQSKRFLTKAKSSARAMYSQSESANKLIDRQKENKVKHIYEMHTKYSMAVVCIIFIFVGAPLGAIVRKGGFGYPLLVSIIVFITFIVLTVFCRTIAETFIMPAAMAAWLPCIIIFPIGLLLTYVASIDAKLFDYKWIISLFKSIFRLAGLKV